MASLLVDAFSNLEILLLIFESFGIIFQTFAFQKLVSKVRQSCIQNKTLHGCAVSNTNITLLR